MPYQLVSLVSRKPGLTLPEFRHHMETHMVPLMRSICGPLAPTTWIRRYIAHSATDAQRKPGPLGLPNLLIGNKEDVGWDAMSEMTFQDELHLQQYFARINEDGPAERLLEEEGKFSDIQKLKLMVVESFGEGEGVKGLVDEMGRLGWSSGSADCGDVCWKDDVGKADGGRVEKEGQKT